MNSKLLRKSLEVVAIGFLLAGRDVISTTLILAAGFSVLAVSTFRINAQLGFLTALAIIMAVLVDFLLLPSLLMLGHKSRKAEENSHAEAFFARSY